MDVYPVTLGPLTLQANRNWVFAHTRQALMARRTTQQGMLRIDVTALPDGGADDAEVLLKAAEKALFKSPPPPPIDVRPPFPGMRVRGSASYELRQNGQHFFSRLWYLAGKDHLLVAIYGCPWAQRDSGDVQEELSECDRMVITARLG